MRNNCCVVSKLICFFFLYNEKHLRKKNFLYSLIKKTKHHL